METTFQLTVAADASLTSWHSQMTHIDSIMYILGYPVFLYISSLFLASIGLKNSFVKHHLLTTQVMRLANASGAIGIVCVVLWRNPHFFFSPFTNHNQEPRLDFLCRFIGCGFHIADIVDLSYAYYKGYMPPPFRTDLIIHHVSVLILAVAYSFMRAEGIICFLIASDSLPIPTFFVMFVRALNEEKLCSDLTAVRISTFFKYMRLVLIVCRMPFWIMLVISVLRDAFILGFANTGIGLNMILLFALVIICVDIKWANQMIVGLSFSRKKYCQVKEVLAKPDMKKVD